MAANTVSSPLTTYFQALDDADFEKAIALFAPDCTYIRQLPPLPNSPKLGDMEIIVGRDEVYAFFQRRGRIPHRHTLRLAASQDNRCFVEGVVAVTDVPGITDMLFLSSAILDDEGLIVRYTGVATVLSEEKSAAVEGTRAQSNRDR